MGSASYTGRSELDRRGRKSSVIERRDPRLPQPMILSPAHAQARLACIDRHVERMRRAIAEAEAERQALESALTEIGT